MSKLVGDRIYSLRKKLGLSQEEFANRIGVEFDEIDFNLPNIKNYCSNLLKQPNTQLESLDKNKLKKHCDENEDEGMEIN